MPVAPFLRRAPNAAAVLALWSVVACRDSSSAPTPIAPLDPSRAEVTVSSASVASGDSVSLTLRTRDGNGRAMTTGGHAVVFVASGGLSRGIISATIDRGDGTYRATFVGVIAGLATTIGATIDGVPVTSPLPTVRVRPGAFSPSRSTLTVTPRTVLAGGRATLELITRDAAGNTLETGGLRVTLTMSGGSAAGVVGPVTDHNNGRYSAIFTAAAVGTPLTAGATVNGTAVTAPPPTVSVARGISLDHSVLTLSSDTVTVNASLNVTFEARDSANVKRTSGGDTVRFVVMTSAGSSEGSIGSVQDHDDGTYSATFTARTAGAPVSIGVIVNGRSKSNSLPALTVLAIPLTAQRSSIGVSADTVEAGQSITLSALLRDLNGVPVTGAAASLQFTIGRDGTSGGTVGLTIEDGEGKYSATFTGVTAGTAVTVGAVVHDSTQIQMLDTLGNSHLPSITVKAGPESADSTMLFADPTTVSVGDSSIIRLVARDPYGNVVKRGGRRVTFSRSGGAGVSFGRIGTVTDRQDGTYTAPYLADSVGTADSIRATIDGRAVTSPPVLITVGPACKPGPVSLNVSDATINDTTLAQRPVKTITLPSGVTSTLILRVRDALRCPVTQSRQVVFATSGGTSTGVIGPTIDLEDGRYTATFTGHTAGSTTTISVRIDGQLVTSEPVRVTVVPGDISTRTSTLTASSLTIGSGDSAVVTLRARDAAGNDIARGARMIGFAVTGSQPGGTMGVTTDHGNGTYSAVYRPQKSPATDVIVAIIEGTRVAQAVAITVAPP